jgi:hypothetical protein
LLWSTSRHHCILVLISSMAMLTSIIFKVFVEMHLLHGL